VLEVRFRKDSRRRLSSVLAAGHAEAGIAGDDVVCAAASAILQAAELGLTSYAALEGVVVRADGQMWFAIPETAREREDVKAIVGTAELAIAQLAWQFPVNVRIVHETEADHASADVEFLGNRESNGGRK
jgi:uncharacterized protein YsxB (DUF464 family)